MLSVSTQIARGDDLATFASMLASVSFADEIIVFNMERKDEACLSVCAQYHAKVIPVKTPPVVEHIRAQEVRAGRGDWVLIMDFDEVITESLKAEIISICHTPSLVSHFAIQRTNFSLGFPLRHGGWGSDYVVRLIRKADFVDWPTTIHSTPQVMGQLGKTTNAMEHHKDISLASMVDKTNRYSDIEASQYFAGHLPPVTELTLLRKWGMESFRRGIMKGGLFDGRIGLIQSLYQGFSVFISYAKLYEKQIVQI